MAALPTVHEPPTPRGLLLADDIWDMPDDGRRYEVIDGRLYVTTAPDLDHQEPSGNLHGYIWQYLQTHRLGKIYTAPVGLILDEHNGLQPDLVYVSRERRGILTRRGIRGVPDLVVEILSPSTAKVDRGVKARRYAGAGVPHYWLLVPESHSLEVYRLAGDQYELVATHGPGDTFVPALFPGLRIPADMLWQEL